MNKSLAVLAAGLLAVAVVATGCTNKKPNKGTTTEIAPAATPPVAYVSQTATPDTTSTPQAPVAEVTPMPADTGTGATGAAATPTHRSTAARTSSSSARRSSNAVSSAGPTRITAKKYTVKKGDTLSEIVKARYGTVKKMKDVLRANPKLDADHIKVGQVINLP